MRCEQEFQHGASFRVNLTIILWWSVSVWNFCLRRQAVGVGGDDVVCVTRRSSGVLACWVNPELWRAGVLAWRRGPVCACTRVRACCAGAVESSLHSHHHTYIIHIHTYIYNKDALGGDLTALTRTRDDY